MNFDAVLPISLFVIVMITAYVYRKLEHKLSFEFEDMKLGKYSAILLVCIMGIIGSILAFLPNNAVQILYLVTLSILLFTFMYVILRKWYIAIVMPVTLLLLYFFYWESLLIFNLFAIILGSIITIFLGMFFSWKSTIIFATLLTILDIVQVFATGFMGQIAEKALQLELPILIVLPTYPTSGVIALGVGDIFLSGLLSLQIAQKYGYKTGTLSALIMSIGMFLFEIIVFNTGYLAYFPATVVIVLSWSLSVGVTRLIYRY
jgi:presenilin-like A22 family membrane protease